MYRKKKVFSPLFYSCVLGVGFSSKTQGNLGKKFVTLQMERFSISKIEAIATLQKVYIPSFLQRWAKDLGNIPIIFFSSTYLEEKVPYINISSSSFVYSSVGCHSVSEAAALAAAGPDAVIFLKKTVFDKMTFSLAGKKK